MDTIIRRNSFLFVITLCHSFYLFLIPKILAEDVVTENTSTFSETLHFTYFESNYSTTDEMTTASSNWMYTTSSAMVFSMTPTGSAEFIESMNVDCSVIQFNTNEIELHPISINGTVQLSEGCSGINITIDIKDSNDSLVNSTDCPTDTEECSWGIFENGSYSTSYKMTILQNERVIWQRFLPVDGGYLSIRSKGSNWIQIGYNLSSCLSTEIENYNITIKNASDSQNGYTFSVELQDSLFNISNDLKENSLQLTSCSQYSINILPIYKNKSKYGIGKSISTWTNPSIESLGVNLTGDDIILTWEQPKCLFNSTPWMILFHNSSSSWISITEQLKKQDNKCELSLRDVSEKSRGLNYSLLQCKSHQVSIAYETSELQRDKTQPTIQVQTPFIEPKFKTDNISYDGNSVNWDGDMEKNVCLKHFEYTIAQNGTILDTNTTVENKVEFKLDLCIRYNITVCIIPQEMNQQNLSCIQKEIIVKPREPPHPTLKVGMGQDNYSPCLAFTLVHDFNNKSRKCIDSCIVKISSSEASWDEPVLLDRDNSKSFLLCNVTEGVNYTLSIETSGILGNNTLPNRYHFYIPKKTSNKTLIIALVVLAIVLIIALIILVIFARPFLLRKFGKRSNDDKFPLGLLPPRGSRPVKLEELPSFVRTLNSSAGLQLEEEFECLRMVSESQKYPCNDAIVPENKTKNRYFNIIPYDHSRVKLSAIEDDPYSDYINASFIQGYSRSDEYIAAQGPTEKTLPDFWRMIWEYKIEIVVMVTSLQERGKEKCAQYWPDNNLSSQFGDILVNNVAENDEEYYCIRSFTMEFEGRVQKVQQFHFTKWPDFGCPENPEVLIHFVEAIRFQYNGNACHGPIVVHCSAGVGRTGTFIAVDWLMQEAQKKAQVDVFNTVVKMRQGRVNMVQTEDQYSFIYDCITHYSSTRLLLGSIDENATDERETLINSESIMGNADRYSGISTTFCLEKTEILEQKLERVSF